MRTLRGEERVYTFWHYMRNRWQRDAGLRLDHLLLSPALKTRLTDGGVDRSARGKENASDHAPVWITLSDGQRTLSATTVLYPVDPFSRPGTRIYALRFVVR
jgi:hypothetical protein